jgi:CheY-like chemotaxis protein/anti-sigma regulatory factor (Ser/Thr protein kinase)
VGQLAGGVAHDFNNLLMVIGGHVELVQQAIAPDHPARASLSVIFDAVEQGAGVTRSLLTFGRKFEARIEPVVPAAVVEEASRLLQRLLPQSVELIVEAPQEPRVWTLVDCVQLKQVILNLALNARDAMPEGGCLRISCRPGQNDALPGTNGEATAVCIEVADTGTGIPPELMERVFDPFFTTKPRGQGTGLGLSIVHGIVKDFGGRIDVKSEVGKGSTFTIILPGHTGEPDDRTAAAPRTVPRGQGETVLLADDNPQILDMLTRALESRGYVVIPAADGEAMLSLWARDRERIRLIVADNDMPKRSGLDSLRQIRQAGSNVPAILITGAVGSEVRDRLDSDTIVLGKPFEISELVERIRKMLDADRRESCS